MRRGPAWIVSVLLAALLMVAPGPAWAAPDQTAYALAPGDVVAVRVVGEPELQTQVRVDQDGTIPFPYVGKLLVEGLTQDAAGRRLAGALEKADVVRDAQVVLTVISFGRQASILGQVGAPGIFPLDRPLSLTQFLARAGGPTVAAADHLLLRRSSPDGTPGDPVKIALDPLLKQGDPALDQQVQDGDIIFIPTAPVYYLYGSVNSPGLYSFRDPITVQQALARGGGVAITGSAKRVRVKRKGPDGQEVEVRIGLDDMVQPDDILIVPERWF